MLWQGTQSRGRSLRWRRWYAERVLVSGARGGEGFMIVQMLVRRHSRERLKMKIDF